MPQRQGYVGGGTLRGVQIHLEAHTADDVLRYVDKHSTEARVKLAALCGCCGLCGAAFLAAAWVTCSASCLYADAAWYMVQCAGFILSYACVCRCSVSARAGLAWQSLACVVVGCVWFIIAVSALQSVREVMTWLSTHHYAFDTKATFNSSLGSMMVMIVLASGVRMSKHKANRKAQTLSPRAYLKIQHGSNSTLSQYSQSTPVVSPGQASTEPFFSHRQSYGAAINEPDNVTPRRLSLRLKRSYSHEAKRLVVGSKVLVQYGEDTNELWYPATISNVHADKSVDVVYDDGDTESHKPSSQVERLERLVAQDIGSEDMPANNITSYWRLALFGHLGFIFVTVGCACFMWLCDVHDHSTSATGIAQLRIDSSVALFAPCVSPLLALVNIGWVAWLAFTFTSVCIRLLCTPIVVTHEEHVLDIVFASVQVLATESQSSNDDFTKPAESFAI